MHDRAGGRVSEGAMTWRLATAGAARVRRTGGNPNGADASDPAYSAAECTSTDLATAARFGLLNNSNSGTACSANHSITQKSLR